MQTPIEQRASATDVAPGGFIVPSGTAALKHALKGNQTAFAEWRKHPITRKVFAALQDAVIHTPASLDPQDRLVQFGMVQGLSYAVQLIADPSMIWPGVFGEGTNEKTEGSPLMDFDTSIDAAYFE